MRPGLSARRLLATLVLMALTGFQTATAQSTTVPATVEVTDGGIFSVTFYSQVNLNQDPNQPLTTTTSSTASGLLGIHYIDTKIQRGSFTVDLSTGNFAFGTYVIPANNLSVAATYNVLQTPRPGVTGVGDIGYYQNNHYVAQADNFDPQPWNPGYTLETPKTVNFGYAGKGTIESLGGVAITLNLPAGTHPGVYVSTLTLTVTMGGL